MLDDADPTDTSLSAAHFGEDQGRFIVTTAQPTALRQIANDAGIKATSIGMTGNRSQTSPDKNVGIWCEASDAFIPLADLRAAHEGFFPKLMGADTALA